MVVRFSAPAPAKVNLALHITGQRDDGYHLIETLAVFTAFGDRVEIAPAEADSFRVRGRYAAAVPIDGQNLVLRARDILRRHHPDLAAPVAIDLDKRLPPSSGIGGGSGDAAAAMHLLNRIWTLGLTTSELRLLGAELGADVPMCLECRPLLAAGIGERIRPVPALPRLPILLVNPAAPLATQTVFRELRRKENPQLAEPPDAPDIETLTAWLAETRNDLEPVARQIEPLVGEALDRIGGTDAVFARMSGSGATCFGLYDTIAAAERAAETISAEKPEWFVVATETISERPGGDERR